MKRQILAAVALAAGMVSSPLAWAATAAPGDTSCLEPIRLHSWNVVNDRTVIVTDTARRNYKVSLMPGCYNLKFAFRLGFKPFSPSRLACMGRGDFITAPGDAGMPRQTCPIDSIVAYTPEMQHADAVNQALDKPH